MRLRLALLIAATPSAALAGGKVPQLDFANPLTISQVIWAAVIFAVFYVLMRNTALPAVASVLEARATQIASDLDASRDAKARADAATAELTQAIERARAEGNSAVNAAVTEAKGRAAEQAAAQAATLDAQLAQAEQRIAASREGAQAAIRTVAHETTLGIVQRLTGLTPDPAALDTAIGHHLARA